MAPPPPSAPAPTISLPSLPLHPPSFSQLLVRRRSSRRQLAHTPSTKTSSSSASAGSIFRRALEAVEEVGREKRVAEWRKREVREGAVESWREEVADEVASELARKEEGKEVVMELRRLIEGSEVFSSSFSPGALHLPSSPTGTPTSVSLNVSSHELEDHLTPLPLPTRTTSLGVDSAMTPARLRLSQQRFNAAAPISPPYPSLYYQFPPHDPSETLAGNSESRPSSPRLRRPRPPRDDPPPPLGSLPPKAAALLGLLPPLQLPSATPPTPTPSSFTALLPSSPILRRTAQAYPNSPSPSTTFSYIDYHLPPRPSFAITDRRGSADSTALSLAAPSTRSATASTVKSFWSSCVPGHSPSNSVSPSSAATSAGPTLPPSMLHGGDTP
ncbi:hypothetical protein BCR35DRAFT_329412 [Leucosporidium creatinivorum]|uniref:Uncharacterized protein n=1 Tax=Leucosporidium creatinivorum TaxID=106004 RepID=A0A1Y2FZG0_9BASI|nr:hypothetical protein BCR35DRAFT_329412 [Leucosporidium creatinivorum]